MNAIKWITTEAKKIRKQFPKRFSTWREYVAQASAIYSSKHGGKSPVGKKKISGSHKDTKSHNVNIRVVSGIVTNYKRGKIGSLPANFSGNIMGVKFRIYIQYLMTGGVVAQVVEDKPGGELIYEIKGKQGEADPATARLVGQIEGFKKLDIGDQKEVQKRVKKFFVDLSKDVKDYNAGKNVKTRKGDRLTIKEKKKPAATAKKPVEKIKDILREDKKRLKYGYTIVPGRVLSGISKNKLFGISNYQDPDAAREIELYADNDSKLYFSRKLPILKNLQKKFKAGKYDIDKAAKLWVYYIEDAMQRYNKEFGSRGDKWFELLSPSDRKLLSLEYAKETLNEFQQGNFIE